MKFTGKSIDIVLELAEYAAKKMKINAASGLKLFAGIKKYLDEINEKMFDGAGNVKECMDFCKYIFIQDGMDGVERLSLGKQPYRESYYIELNLVNQLVPNSWAILSFKAQGKTPARLKLLASWEEVGKCEISDGITKLNGIEEFENYYIWIEKTGKSYYLYKDAKEELSDNLAPVVMKENFTEMFMPFMVNIIFQHDKLEEFGLPWADLPLKP